MCDSWSGSTDHATGCCPSTQLNFPIGKPYLIESIRASRCAPTPFVRFGSRAARRAIAVPVLPPPQLEREATLQSRSADARLLECRGVTFDRPSRAGSGSASSPKGHTDCHGHQRAQRFLGPLPRQPFVERERSRRRDTGMAGVPPGFMPFFEHLAARTVQHRSGAQGRQLIASLKLKTMPDTLHVLDVAPPLQSPDPLPAPRGQSTDPATPLD